MIAGEPVCVLDDALFIDIHEDLLPTHGTHAVGEVFGGHARLAVELEESRREGQKSCERHLPGAHAASAVRKQVLSACSPSLSLDPTPGNGVTTVKNGLPTTAKLI